jgi:flagella synthesis protein FlgN
VFVAGLRAERDAFLEFRDLLQTERACLLRSDVDALLDVTRRKSEQVDRLVDLGNARISYLEARGIEPGSSDIERWLADHAAMPGIDAGASEVIRLWRELTEIARNARAMNEANGKLITARLTHNQGALSALQSGARPNTLYGPDGQTNVSTRNRVLGRA